MQTNKKQTYKQTNKQTNKQTDRQTDSFTMEKDQKCGSTYVELSHAKNVGVGNTNVLLEQTTKHF